MDVASLNTLVHIFQKITDPLYSKGVRHNFHWMLALILLGLLAKIPSIAI